jgi:predicted nuclease of predicted toxin-antitoxin system
MAHLYADEQFPRSVSELLRKLGHDILTVQEAGNANQRIPDDQVLIFAHLNNRAVITLNHKDFAQLHRINPQHAGIISCTNDLDRPRMASRIDAAIAVSQPLEGQFIRVVRPST